MVLIISLSFVGCKKDPVSLVGALTSGKWNIVNARVSPSIGIVDNQGTITSNTSDLWSLWEDCRKDEAQTYFADGSFEYFSNIPCPNQSSGFTAKWAFNEDETTITETYPDGSTFTFTVVSITDTELQLSTKEQFRNQLHTVTLTFRH